MDGVLVLLVIAVIGAGSFFLQLTFFRRCGADLPLTVQLRRLSGLPIFAFFYLIIVPPLALCFGMPNPYAIVGYFLGIGLLCVGGFFSQMTIFYLTLERAVILHRQSLAAENSEVKERLVWYLRHFAWIPGRRLSKNDLKAIIDELSTH